MKDGIDYFPFDTCLDDKFELIEAEFGLTGFSIVVKLFQKIYGGQGYYCEWTNEVALLFGLRTGAGGNVVSEIVSASIKRGIFNSTMYEKYQILTSVGIQKRYLEAVSRRKVVEIDGRYLLLSHTQISKYANILIKNVDIFEKNAYISEQSKVKESKGKESIKDVCSEPGKPVSKQPVITLTLNDKTEYPVYQKEVEEWAILYPGVDVQQQLRNMKGWLNANPNRRKTKSGILRFINSWLAFEQNKRSAKPEQKTNEFSSFDTNEFFNAALERTIKCQMK